MPNLTRYSRERTSKAARVEVYAAQNIEAACIIAADPRRYSSVLQEWACAVLRRRNNRPLHGRTSS